MKKVIAIILVLVMSTALFACGNGQDNASTTDSTQPSGSTIPSEQPSTSAPSSPSPSSSTSAVTETPTLQPVGGSLGFVTDDVDHWARDSYHLVYYNFRPSNLAFQIMGSYEKLGELYNFTIEQISAGGDADAYINNLRTILLKEPDGLIIDITQELAPRVAEICEEYGVPVICLFNKAINTDGIDIIPSVILDQDYNGRTQVDFLNNSYSEFWGDVDRSEIALLIMTWSTNLDFTQRAEGMQGEFEELFPGNQIFIGDTAAAGAMSAEEGFNVANSILSSHPEIKYWFITNTIEDITTGAVRAVEALGLEDRVLVISTGAAILPGQWESGYEGVWFANYALPPMMSAGVSLFGMIALIDGRATYDTLWPEYILPGAKAARYLLTAGVMTKPTFKTYMDDCDRMFGVEPDA